MGLTSNIKDKDWVSVRQATAKLGSIKLGPTSTPTFAGVTTGSLTITGLTTNSLIYPVAGLLTSLGAATDGQIPIGSTGVAPVLATLTGTANQVNIANAAGTITLSTPQDIDSTSTPTFVGVTLSGLTQGSVLFAGSGGVISEDNTGLFWDDTNNRLGINTATPAQTFEIEGVDDYRVRFNVDGADKRVLFEVRNDTVAGAGTMNIQAGAYGSTYPGSVAGINLANSAWMTGYATNVVYGNKDAGDVAFIADATEWMRISSAGKVSLSGTTPIGLDMSSGTFGTANINLAADPIIQANGTQILHSDATNANLILGDGAGASITLNSAQFNTLLGDDAGNSLTTGDNNILIGYQAGYSQTIESSILAIGYQAGYSQTTGDYNLSIGYKALYACSTGLKNVGIGHEALTATTDGENNFALGYRALYSSTSDNENIAIGAAALFTLDGGGENTAIGSLAGYTMTTGDANTLVGKQSGFTLDEGVNNTAIGYQAGYSETTSDYGVYIGFQAGYNSVGDTTIGRNVAIGALSLYNDLGDLNIAIGYRAGYYNDATGGGVTGDRNVYIGAYAGQGPAAGNTGYYNVAIGEEALRDNTSGNTNFALGFWSLYENTSGNSNIGIGFQSLRYNTTGHYNVCIGSESGEGAAGGDHSRNTFIGYRSGWLVQHGSGNICVGHYAGENIVDESDLLIISNQNEASIGAEGTNALIYGVMNAAPASQSLRINGSFRATGYSVNIVAKTAAYTATVTDDVITCGAGNETFTIDLPAPVSGKTFYIKNVGTGVITVDADTTGSTTIDGDTTQTVNQYECLKVVSDASVYWAI